MSRRLTTVACGALAVLVVVLAGPRGARADDGDVARNLLVRARDAVSDNEFDGAVAIEWSDAGRRYKQTVSVKASDGVLRVGDGKLVSSGTRRLLHTDDGWQLLWAGEPHGSEPDPTRKYRFVVARPAKVATRPATQVAVRAGTSRVRERLFFDDATGILLPRDQLDANGRLLRRFAFVEMSDPQPIDGGKKHSLPKVDPKSSQRPPHALDGIPDDLRAPERVGNGFSLSGTYSQPDGSVQLYYTDGLLGLSVFEREGALAWESLPEGGSTTELGGVRTRVYRTAGDTAVVWGDDGVAYTVVTDAPLDEITAVAHSLSGSDDSSPLEDVGRFVTAPFSWN